ncbi:hypothetical protein ACFLWN_04995 [Chloroflexota bacterium]
MVLHRDVSHPESGGVLTLRWGLSWLSARGEDCSLEVLGVPDSAGERKGDSGRRLNKTVT